MNCPFFRCWSPPCLIVEVTMLQHQIISPSPKSICDLLLLVDLNFAALSINWEKKFKKTICHQFFYAILLPFHSSFVILIIMRLNFTKGNPYTTYVTPTSQLLNNCINSTTTALHNQFRPSCIHDRQFYWPQIV